MLKFTMYICPQLYICSLTGVAFLNVNESGQLFHVEQYKAFSKQVLSKSYHFLFAFYPIIIFADKDFQKAVI